jgi:hypothetical protein
MSRNRHVAQRFRSEPSEDDEDKSSAHKLDGIGEYERKSKSIQRTYERLLGRLALLAEWENTPDVDIRYLQELRKRVDTLRVQLRYKGGVL